MDNIKREAIEQRFNRIVVFFCCLLVIALPISIALVESMAGFVILLFLTKKILLCRHDIECGRKPDLWGFIIPRVEGNSHLNRAAGVYLGFAAVSIIFSQFPMESFTAFIGKVLEGYCLYVCFVDCIKTRRHLKKIIVAAVLTLLLIAIDGIAQFFLGFDLLRHRPIFARRASATLRHANDLGAYLITFIPIVFAILLLPLQRGSSLIKEWNKGFLGTDVASKVISGFTFCLTLVCLGLTFSRGSWVGFLVSIIIFGSILRRYLVHILIISLVFLVVFLPFLSKIRDVSFTSDNVTIEREYSHIDPTPENLEKMTEGERARVAIAHRLNLGMGRFGFWEEATALIKKYPLTGSGLNTYSKLENMYAHNCYLQMGAEIGIPGLLAFLVMVGVVFLRALRSLAELKDPYWEAMLVAFLSGMAAFLIQSFFDTTLYSVQLGALFWVMVGLIGAVSRVRLMN